MDNAAAESSDLEHERFQPRKNLKRKSKRRMLSESTTSTGDESDSTSSAGDYHLREEEFGGIPFFIPNKCKVLKNYSEKDLREFFYRYGFDKFIPLGRTGYLLRFVLSKQKEENAIVRADMSIKCKGTGYICYVTSRGPDGGFRGTSRFESKTDKVIGVVVPKIKDPGEKEEGKRKKRRKPERNLEHTVAHGQFQCPVLPLDFFKQPPTVSVERPPTVSVERKINRKKIPRKVIRKKIPRIASTKLKKVPNRRREHNQLMDTFESLVQEARCPVGGSCVKHILRVGHSRARNCPVRRFEDGEVSDKDVKLNRFLQLVEDIKKVMDGNKYQNLQTSRLRMFIQRLQEFKDSH